MKHWVIGIFLLMGSSLLAQQSASEILYEAKDRAKVENKNIFLMFHASWCGWCKRMEENMENELVKAYFDANFVKAFMTVQEQPKNVHLETLGGTEVLNQLGGERQGLPYWVILDAEGNLLSDSKVNNENLGCPATEEEINHLLEKLEKHSKQSKPDSEAIQEVFILKKK